MTPKEVCRTKCAVVREFRPHSQEECGFGTPNPINDKVSFSGCPSCHRASERGDTEGEVQLDMRRFMKKIQSGHMPKEETNGEEA